MQRVAEELLDRRDLLDLAAVHDRDAIARLGDDGEVVGDEQNRGVLLPRLHLQHQIQNLRLDRDVERRRRLVGDEERGVQHERHGDHHALAHAARELMRILRSSARGASGMPTARSISTARSNASCFEIVLVLQVHLHQLHADREDRVERRHRLLEDHADLAAADVADRLPSAASADRVP